MTENTKKEFYISPAGIDYDCWECPCLFYPDCVMSEEDKLDFYSTKFNSLTITSTFQIKLEYELMQLLKKNAEKFKSFKYIVYAPENMIFAKNQNQMKAAWNNFWIGGAENGISYLQKYLGCIVLHFHANLNFHMGICQD